MKVAITGGAGFIGSNLVHHMLREHPEYELVVVDKLTYAGNLSNLAAALSASRIRFVRMDICDAELEGVLQGCDAVLHLAAESHVDRSIENAAEFVRTNVDGTWRVVESCRRAKVGRLVHVSTDEVYGSLGPTGRFTESSPLAPNSPYAATKASADLVVLSYVSTHGYPAIVTRCSNNYGPYQFPEKFIPLMIAQALAGRKLPVYGDGQNVRDWIHVSDHCRALDLVLHRGREGEIYNIGGDAEVKNLEVVRMILSALGGTEEAIQFVIDRPGHDRRYAMDFSKLQRELGWTPSCTFAAGLSATIAWYQENGGWLEETRSGQYQEYFDRHYARRKETFSTTTALAQKAVGAAAEAGPASPQR